MAAFLDGSDGNKIMRETSNAIRSGFTEGSSEDSDNEKMW